ncbi:MAG: sigma-70 family RNA polymerase sigma factor [Lachnospiraceae bacterium]|nr:sigma-70 family RNA polymerase sigma factor [Lachnospiraceae bacterium]
MYNNAYDTWADEDLIVHLRRGEEDIMDYLMIKYKGLVRSKAKAMFLLGGENDDLIQEGMIGLMKAVRNFDENQGAAFSTFANLCISRQMYTAIEWAGRMKHMPLNYYVSLYEDETSDDEKKPFLIDTIESEANNNPEVLYFGKELIEGFIERLTKRLSPLENKVLPLHLLGHDYQHIAKILDKTPKAIDNALQRCKQKAEKLLQEEM